jgi:hypothetical protein
MVIFIHESIHELLHTITGNAQLMIEMPSETPGYRP